ncbi:MAG: nicotinate-nucleotide adenylyltransferase [Gammaproteobacteria bacterium]|nr:nicotinate-nucleotide adenylyltransferase [Gammaproteobacteria bacterium]
MSDAKATSGMKIGILGGSFDPVHFGHIKPSLELAEKFQFDSIRLIPCKISPFKDETFASAQHRWNMVSIIAGSSELFEADARELKRETPSFTYETLREIASEVASNSTLFWIMGEDALIDFPRWHQAEKIMQLCHVLVMRRPGYEVSQNVKTNAWLQPYMCDDVSKLSEKRYGYIYISNVELLDISSTKIRETVHAGEQPRFMLPGGVWNYIKRNNLYQESVN